MAGPGGACHKKDLIFFDSDRALFANFNAGLTTETFFFVHRDSLAILKFVNFNGTDVYTLATSDALLAVDDNRITHDQPPKFFVIPACAG
jgi:hypothetical protein